MTFEELAKATEAVENDGSPSMRTMIEELRSKDVAVGFSYRFPVRGRTGSISTKSFRPFSEYVLIGTADGDMRDAIVPYSNIVGISIERGSIETAIRSGGSSGGVRI